MHVLLIVLLGLGLFVAGYGFRGFIGRKLVATDKELKAYADLLEQSLAKDVTAARNDVAFVLTAIKAKLPRW